MNENLARFLAGLPVSSNGNAGAFNRGGAIPAFARLSENAIRNLKPANLGDLGGFPGLVAGTPGTLENFSTEAKRIIAGAGDSNARLRAGGGPNVGGADAFGALAASGGDADAADAFGALAAFDSADADGGGETESKRRKTCENAIDNLRSNPNYRRSDVVIGILLYHNIFGGAQYGGVEVLAVQLNRANSDFPITIPNANNCEGTKDADELRDCMRRRPIEWGTEPGRIYSFGNSGLPLAGIGKTPFALLVSQELPEASRWAKELNISRDKILVDTCEGL